MTLTFEQLVKKYFLFLTEDPNVRVNFGINRKLDQLPNNTFGYIKNRDIKGTRLLGELELIDARKLTREQRLDLALCQLTLNSELFKPNYNGKTDVEQMPIAAKKISQGIYNLLMLDRRTSRRRLDDILGRIEKIPVFLNQAYSLLNYPVKLWVDIENKSIREIPIFLDSICRWAQEENYPKLCQLKKAITSAMVSIDDYCIKLDRLPTTDNFIIGEEQAQKILKVRGIDLSFNELRLMAKRFLRESRRELTELNGRLTKKYGLPVNTGIEQVHNYLNHRFALQVDSIFTEYQTQQNKIYQFVKSLDTINIPAEQEIILVKTPSFLQQVIPAGAMDEPRPFDPGIKRSIIYLTIKPGLEYEHTLLSIPIMLVHEGIPGHHLHYVYGTSHSSIIRKTSSFMDSAEGWTTYHEEYLLNKGLMGDLTNESHFVTNREMQRLGARVAIDLYFMTGNKKYLQVGVKFDDSSDNPLVNASNLLKKVTGFTDDRIVGELNWYSQERGYPSSYLVGYNGINVLKAEVAAAHPRLNEKELDQLFHQNFLESGVIPISLIRERFKFIGLIKS